MEFEVKKYEILAREWIGSALLSGELKDDGLQRAELYKLLCEVGNLLSCVADEGRGKDDELAFLRRDSAVAWDLCQKYREAIEYAHSLGFEWPADPFRDDVDCFNDPL